jgi:hypothetical protein
VMQNGGNSIGPAAAIYEECSFLCRNFAHVSFSHHCPRKSNRAAHILASKAESPHLTTWQEELPDFISALIMDDVSLFPN